MCTLGGLSVFAVVLAAQASAAAIYNFTSFDGPGNNGGGTTVNGINNNGVAVGFSSDNAANPTLFTNFTRGAGGLFSVLNLGSPLAMANGVNNAGTVVGGSNNSAFLLSGANLATLAPVNTTTVSEIAFGINDGGLVVGQFTDGNTDTTPGFLLAGGNYTILNPKPTAIATNAQGVNNLGLVTGFYSLDGVHQHGFFYDSTTHQYTLPPDPNIPNLVLTQFLGINDNGLVVGYYQLPDGSQHGLLYNTVTQGYLFLDDPNAATSGVSITQITGVSNSGEIDGFYVDAVTGLQRGFIATPVVSGAAPEPRTFALLPGSLLLLALLKHVRTDHRPAWSVMLLVLRIPFGARYKMNTLENPQENNDAVSRRATDFRCNPSRAGRRLRPVPRLESRRPPPPNRSLPAASCWA